MGLFNNSVMMGASGAGAYEIKRSLRFNSADDPYIIWQPSSDGNQKIWTWSAWVKRVKLGVWPGVYLMSCNAQGDSGNTGIATLYFDNNDKLKTYFDTSGTDNAASINDAVYRDVSAWMHIVWQVDAGNTDQKVWVNGVEQTVASGSKPVDFSYQMNKTGSKMVMGATAWDGVTSHGDLYLAEVHYCDGQKYQASDFGETDSDTGQWIPKEVSGLTYGTNGCYLNFSDNSNTTDATLGKDSSGNSNNWTPNNFSVSAGVGNDSLEDTPTNNFATLNPLDGYSTVSYDSYNGCLDFNISDNSAIGLSTMSIPTSGKWYAECTCTDVESTGFGIRETQFVSYSNSFETGILYLYYGKTWKNNSEIETVTAISDGDIVGCAVDRDNNTVQFSLNGTNVGNTIAMTTTDEYQWWVARGASSGGNPQGSVNFGQRAFSHQPSGFVGLCTNELPTPTIKKGSDYFVTKTYSGTGSTQTITTGIDADLVWVKRRNNTQYHILADTVRGAGHYFVSNNDDASSDGGSQLINGFNSTGFQVGTESAVNNSSGTYASWSWKESATAGFDIVTYTGNATNRTIAHSLGVKPDFLVVKNRSSSGNWTAWHEDFDGNDLIYLDTDAVKSSGITNVWNDTEPTSSVFSLGTSGGSNANGDDYIAYLFSSVKGYSKIGTYLGNGNANGPFVYCGFKPAYILSKRIDTTPNAYWNIFDTARDPYNSGATADFKRLRVESDSAEATNHTNYTPPDILSNGFKIRHGRADLNYSGKTFIFLAFAESPFKYANAR